MRRVPSASPVTFTYVEAAPATLKVFVSHPDSYRGFVRALPAFEFLYVAPSDWFFEAAAHAFSKLLSASKEQLSAGQVLRYFEVRNRWEAGERVSASDVVFLNTARTQLRNPTIESQYRKWAAGELKPDDVARPLTQEAPRPEAHFRTILYGDSLTIFASSSMKRGEKLVPKSMGTPFT